MGDPAAEHELVMPFVAVASKGGPYDDGAYCAGYEMGQLDTLLERGPRGRLERTIRSANAAQADLIAMQHGYVCTAQPAPEDPDWTLAVFEPAR
jgi:hypothetical protein